MNTGKYNKKALISLAIGGFGIGLTEFVIMGILPDVALSMGISIPKASHFIAAYALGVVIGAPLFTQIAKRWDANRSLLYLMIWFTIFNTLSAFATSYSTLLLYRLLSGLPHGAFFGIGAVIAGKLAKEGKSAQAIAIMFTGLTIANVIGVPVGTYIGHSYAWSASFLMVGVSGFLALLSIYFWMPKLVIEQPSANAVKPKGLKNMELWTLIALTTIGTGGFFAWYSFIAPLVHEVAGFPENVIGYAMIIAGLGMVAGNFVGAKMAEIFKPLRAVAISLTAMVVLLLLNTWLAYTPSAVLGLTFLIGMTAFSVSTPLQMAIIQASKGSEMLGSSLNQSAFNLGNALGAYLAGIPIAYGLGYTAAGLVGAILAGTGVMLSLLLILLKRYQDGKWRQLAISGGNSTT